jgi:hypothetical protein
MERNMASIASGADRRTLLWNAMIVADFNVAYWSLMSQRYTRHDDLFRLMLGISTSGVLGWGIWKRFPLGLSILSGVVCLAAWLHPMICPTDRMNKTAILVGAWKQILGDYEYLWDFDQELAGPENWIKFQDAKKIQRHIDESGLPVDPKIRLKAWDEIAIRRKF